MQFSQILDPSIDIALRQPAMIIPSALATTDFDIPDWTKPDESRNEGINNDVALELVNTTVIVPNKLYSATVEINASDNILSQIEKVTYLFHSTFSLSEITKFSSDY
jgi:hypothetical protein